MSNIEQIRALALQGLCHSEVADQMRHLRPDTVRVYFNRVVSSLEPSERSAMEQARASRPSAPPRSSYHRSFAEREAFGPEHIRIGRKLLAKRMEEHLSLSEFAKDYGLSNRVTLSAMEQGYHDFTMSEIKIIAEILQTTIEDLMCPPPGALAA